MNKNFTNKNERHQQASSDGFNIMKTKHESWIWIVLGIWTVLNIIQAINTELSNDEAYYWMYSKALAWGYFDHPPLIALLIKTGYYIFEGELGVRVFSVILSSLTIYLLYRLCNPKKSESLIFLVIIFSIPLVHVGGFFATPDIPLIFFVTVFFYIYKKYLDADRIQYAIFLAVIMALMMYSKYHGVLVILFSILSNLQILKRKSFWGMSMLSVVLFIPHIYWQYVNEFPTIKYHLFERSIEAYKIENTLNYLASQWAVIGPLAGVILLVAALKVKNTSSFIRCLKFNLSGILIFFFLSSFKSRVEANWTSAAFIPLIILSFEWIRSHDKWKKWTLGLTISSIVLIVAARVILALNTIPFPVKFKSEFHLWDKWAEQLHQKAAGCPVVFMNSYQNASKYAFYSGGFAHSLNNFMYRKNQFDLWPFEDSIQGKRILLIANYEAGLDTFITPHGEKYNYMFNDNFQSYNKINIKLNIKEVKCKASDTLNLSISLINRGSYDANFSKDIDYSSQLSINFYLDGIYNSSQFYPLEKQLIKRGEIVDQKVTFLAPENPGRYKFRIAISTAWLPHGLNSEIYPLEVLKGKK